MSSGRKDVRGRQEAATPAPPLSRRETVGSSGARHSVSTKIMTGPFPVPAVSTFPLAIQRYMVRRLTSTRSHAFRVEIVGLWAAIAALNGKERATPQMHQASPLNV